jgi:hypothetical protein
MGATNYQSADVAARSAVVCMADGERHGQLVYSECGKFMDLENGERGFHKWMKGVLEGGKMEVREKVESVSGGEGKEKGEELNWGALKDLAKVKEELEKKQGGSRPGMGERKWTW